MKILFLGASNTDCDHCFSEDNLGYGYVKMVHDLLQTAQKNIPSKISLSAADCSLQIHAGHSGTPSSLPKGVCTSTIIINGGTDGFTFPRIYRKWEQNWKGTAFDAVFILGGINEVGALMDSGMDETSHRELLQHSADALSSLLASLSVSGCPQIFVLEPFLFDTPEYLKSWMETLEEVREMIRQTVASHRGNILSVSDLSSNSEFPVHFDRITKSVLPAFFSLRTDSGFHATPDHMSADISRIQTVQNSFCRVHLLPTQPLLDDAVQKAEISEITKDGIHLAQEGHRVLAEMIVNLIDTMNTARRIANVNNC
ncbi:MAG: hypothetical protein PUE72_08455 [Lachnospiraceae bacterium]|nr:hypothetical protein [Lachnospiraceae bacterium]